MLSSGVLFRLFQALQVKADYSFTRTQFQCLEMYFEICLATSDQKAAPHHSASVLVCKEIEVHVKIVGITLNWFLAVSSWRKGE